MLRNVRERSGAKIAVTFEHGVITHVGEDRASGCAEIDGEGATVLPALYDHHVHILSSLAKRHSVDLGGYRTATATITALRQAATVHGDGAGVRATGYDERVAGLPDRVLLDQWLPETALRLQDRTGALWVLNSVALSALRRQDLPEGAERDADGVPTGRFWRCDDWLGRALPRPDLNAYAAIWGRELAVMGVAGLTDAGVHNGPDEAATLANMHRSELLPQRLMLMGCEDLPSGDGYKRGPLKLLYDERDIPDFDDYVGRIAAAHAQGRNVAAHCVSEAELALFIAALDAAGGVVAGDRVEHGSIIGTDAIVGIAERGLTVVTNPSFVHGRGDRYLAEVGPTDQPHLYRAASLLGAGIGVAAGSDAPYGSCDPWLVMRSARDRLTAQGKALGADEAITAELALKLYLGTQEAPASDIRTISVGQPADLMLCHGRYADILADLSAERVAATFIAGKRIV